MTRIGKILVLVNFLFALTFSGWAVGLYTQRVDWAFRVDEGGKIKPDTGEIGRLRERIALLQRVRDPALARWQTARTALARLEAERAKNQEWYAEQIKILETGRDREGKEVPLLALKEKD
ncbi:MAG: hypothetical protein NZ700_15950, partial [Gemmataceae bacterium]|nr:hypothetical protein [Gemmataceae bacterium]MDW8264431.1 hypothetical protein [Gemmataceae bacterium]